MQRGLVERLRRAHGRVEEVERREAVGVLGEQLLLQLGALGTPGRLGPALGLADDGGRLVGGGLGRRLDGVVEEDRQLRAPRRHGRLLGGGRAPPEARRARARRRCEPANGPARHLDRRHAGREHERDHQHDGEQEERARPAQEAAERDADEAPEPAAAPHHRAPAGDEARERRDARHQKRRAHQPEAAEALRPAPQERDREVAEVEREEIRRDAEGAQRRSGERLPDRPAQVRVRGVG